MILIFNWLYDFVKVFLQCKDTNFLEYANFLTFFSLTPRQFVCVAEGGRGAEATLRHGCARGWRGEERAHRATAPRPTEAKPFTKEGTYFFKRGDLLFFYSWPERIAPGQGAERPEGGQERKARQGGQGQEPPRGGQRQRRERASSPRRPAKGAEPSRQRMYIFSRAQRGRRGRRRRHRRPSHTQAHEWRPTPTPPHKTPTKPRSGSDEQER